MIQNFDRWSKKVTNFPFVCFQVTPYRCIVSKTLNSKWSIEPHKLSSRDNFSSLNFQLANDFTSEKKRLIDTRDKRNDICYKFVAENSHFSDCIKEEHRVSGSCEFENWSDQNDGHETCFAHLWKRITGSLPVNYNNSSFMQSGYEDLIAGS